MTGRTDPRVVEAVRQAQRTPVMTWSPAHLAVEQQDLPRLRDLLDGGHDVEDDGHGWTLLRHAIDVEHDGHVQTGGPLHAAVTVFLLARGADPLRPINGAPPSPRPRPAGTGWPPRSCEPGSGKARKRVHHKDAGIGAPWWNF